MATESPNLLWDCSALAGGAPRGCSCFAGAGWGATPTSLPHAGALPALLRPRAAGISKNAQDRPAPGLGGGPLARDGSLPGGQSPGARGAGLPPRLDDLAPTRTSPGGCRGSDEPAGPAGGMSLGPPSGQAGRTGKWDWDPHPEGGTALQAGCNGEPGPLKLMWKCGNLARGERVKVSVHICTPVSARPRAFICVCLHRGVGEALLTTDFF